MRCTQKPTSAVGSGMYCDFRPLVMTFHDLPPSSVRHAAADEMAMKMRFGLVGSMTIVCNPMPPAPGAQLADCCSRNPGSSFHVIPPLVDLKMAASSTPA